MRSAHPRTRRRLAGLAASLGVHLALLAAFMSVAPRLVTVPHLEPPTAPALEVELQRPAASASAPAAAAQRAPRTVATPTQLRLLQVPRPSVRPSALPAQATSATPATPTARAATSSAAGTATGATLDDGRWRVKGGGGDATGDAARALARGTVGCGAAQYLHLTSAELDHCYAEYIRGMHTLTPDAIPAAKRAYYDQVTAAYAKMHAPMPMSHANLADNLGVEERWNAPAGAHMPAFGCKIPIGQPPRDWKTYANRNGPPHSLRMGRLPCFITPPSGYGTEEADVPPPASLREQQDDAAHAAKYAPPGG